MRWLMALLLTCGVAYAAPFGTSRTPPGGTTGPQVIWQYCAPSTADPLITPCTATAANPSLSSIGATPVTSTYVAKINTGAFVSPTGSPTTVTVSLYGTTGTATPLSNLCIGSGGGPKAQDFSATPTIICGSEIGGAPACSSIGANGVILPATTFTLNTAQPLMISWDTNSATYNRPYSIPKVQTPANVFPAATAVSNYNTYNKNNVKEACTATKGTSYASNFNLSSNIIAVIKKITVQ